MPKKQAVRSARKTSRPAYDGIKDEAEHRGHYGTRPAEAVNRTDLEREKTVERREPRSPGAP